MIDEEELARVLLEAWNDMRKPNTTYGDITDALARAAIAYIVPKVREECAKVAERCGRPVGAGDGNTYTAGSSTDAAAAIRNRQDTRP